MESQGNGADSLAQRIADAMQYRKDHKLAYNHTPYGFIRIGDQLGRYPVEQAVIARIKLQRSNGSTLRQIADALNRSGVPTKKGKTWFAQTVKDVLDNSLNSEQNSKPPNKAPDAGKAKYGVWF
jgi:hypothetical protein